MYTKNRNKSFTKYKHQITNVISKLRVRENFYFSYTEFATIDIIFKLNINRHHDYII